MFLLAFPSPKTPIRTITRSLSLFASLPPQPTRESDEGEVSITNRNYWTKKIHRLCAVDNDVDGALRLLDHLRLSGYFPDSLNISSIIHALCESRRFSEAHHHFSLAIDSGCVPDERTCNVLIARLLDSKNPYCTLHVFHRLTVVKPHFVPNLVNYNRFMDQFCRFSRPVEAHRLFVDMRSRGQLPNAVSYTTLINGYSKTGDVVSAQKLFDEMSECGVQPNPLTYSVLVRGILRKRMVGRGKELMGKLWQKMVDTNDSSVNNAAFADIIDSLCREGLFQDVFIIAEDMPQGKNVPEEFAYGQMIDSLCKVGRHNGAARVVYIMKMKGFIPSLVSYNSIIHGLCKEGSFMRAYQLLEEGSEFGYLPSEYTYTVLIEGLCLDADLCKAKEVFQIMLKKEGVDRTRIYNIYLRALCLTNNPTELLNVLVFMLQSQCKPDVITLNTIISGFCRMGRIEEALKIMNDMLVGKFNAPDAVTFTTVISGMLNVGRIGEALDLLHKVMPEKGVRPGVVTYNAVLRGLFKLHRESKAMEVFGSLVSDGGVANSTTYAIMIDGFCDNQIEEAKRFWDDVIWPSKIHDDFVCAAILKGLCRSGKFNEACDFLYELVDCGVSPNIVNYNILINSACKLGLKTEAYQIVGEMRKNGLTPDAVTWRILEKLHGGSRKQGDYCVPMLICFVSWKCWCFSSSRRRDNVLPQLHGVSTAGERKMDMDKTRKMFAGNIITLFNGKMVLKTRNMDVDTT